MKNHDKAIIKLERLSCLRLLIGLALSGSLLSCTRADDKNLSQVKLALPKTMASSQKVGALAADILAHVVINVTGEGITAPIVYNWDLHQNGQGQGLTVPIQLTIPQGNNRLIQVLAVYGSASNSTSMQFYYGDKIQNLSSANETVTLAVSSVSATADPVFSGRINGRYLRAANDAGITGVMTASYSPPNGRPPLIIETRMMVAGWFSIMGLYGAKFTYNAYPLDGTAPVALFGGGAVDLSETYFPPSSTVARFTIPISQRQNNNNGAATWSLQNPNVTVYGFWGPTATATAGLNACVYSTPVSTQYANSNATTPASSNLAADISGTVPASIATATGLPAMYLQAAPATANGTGACTGAVNFTNSLVVNPLMYDNGNDGSTLIYGPFEQMVAANSTSGPQVFTATALDSSNYNIKATLLPGAADAIASFNIFKYYGSPDYLPDPLLCDPDSLAQSGFSALTNSPVSAAGWSANLAISTSDVANKINLAICPVLKSGRPLPQGVLLRYYSLQNYSMPVYPPTQYVAKIDGSLGQGLILSTCVPVSLNLYNSMSQPADMTGRTENVTYTVDATVITGLFSDSNCTSALANPIVFNGFNRSLFYLKTSATSGNGSMGFSGSLPALNYSGSLFTIAAATANAIDIVDAITMNSISGWSYVPYSCNMGFLQANYGSAATGYSNYSYTVPTNINMYTDSACAGTPVTSIIAGASTNTTTPVYFMVNGTATTASFSLTNSLINMGVARAFSLNSMMAATGTLTAIPQSLGGTFGSNVILPMSPTACTAFEVGFFDATGNRGLGPSGSTATLSDDKGGALLAALSTSSTCSTMGVSTQTLAGQSRILLYGRSSTALSGTLTISGAGMNTGSAKVFFQ